MFFPSHHTCYQFYTNSWELKQATHLYQSIYLQRGHRGRRDRDRMVVGFTTTYAISVYHH